MADKAKQCVFYTGVYGEEDFFEDLEKYKHLVTILEGKKKV